MTIENPYLHHSEPGNQAHLRLKRYAPMASMAVAVILIGVKFFSYLATNSVSLLSSLMDSLFDALASGVTLISIIHASAPADHDHRFGHGKVEALGALAQALFILASAIFLFVTAAQRIVHPQAIHDATIGIYVMVLSIVLTVALILFQTYVIKKTKSVAVSADFLHYRGDVMMNISVFISLALTYYTHWLYFDPLFAMVIAVTLLFGVYRIGIESFDILLDKEISAEDRKKIETLVKAHPRVAGIHDLRTRNSGERIFIEFHIEVEPKMPIDKVHDIMDELEVTVFSAFPKSEVLIHPEPEGLDDFRLDKTLA